MPKPLRILYAAGHGNVIGTYEHWSEEKDDPSQVSVTYSGQFFDVCRRLNAEAWVIAARDDRKTIKGRNMVVEHRPLPFPKASGLAYHVSQLLYGLGIIRSALQFQADAVIVVEGTTHWFILSLLSLVGIQVVPSLHCLLWRKFIPVSKKERILFAFDRYLFSKFCSAILVVSDDIALQVKALTNGHNKPIFRFTPIYRPDRFEGVPKPSAVRSPFRVLYVGRVEAEKGVFDLVDVAKSLREQGRQDIVFDICGDGSSLEQLRASVQAAGLQDVFHCYGYCNYTQMRERFAQSHVVIVPTRADFIEGFNKVVVEGVLSGRPVITSAVCPALASVQDAVVEVPVNQTMGYRDAIVQLCDDAELYAQKMESCVALQEQFYDAAKGWGAIAYSVMKRIQDKQQFEISESDELSASVLR